MYPFNHVSARPALRLSGNVFHRLMSLVEIKTTRTIIVIALMAGLPYLVPGLERYRLVGVRQGGLAGNIATSDDAPGVQSVSAEDASVAAPATMVPGQIEDPSGHALDRFFAALTRVQAGAGHVVITHYGDSPITNDGITSTVRRELQLKFGDAGHGFILASKPWGWYGHEDVVQEPGPGWDSDPMFISKGDHLFGFGGNVSFTSRTGATTSFGTSDVGKTGHNVSSFDVYYLIHPGGGDFDAEVDGTIQSHISTAGDANRSGFASIRVAGGPHKLTLRTSGNGDVRLFGVALESDTPGVEYDSLGVNGAYIGLLSHYMDEQHWAEQLKHRAPNLVILNYGTNESQYENWPMDQYERDTLEVVRRIKAALPEASILFVSPMDRGTRGPGGSIITRPTIPRLVAYQRKFAAETGCAFLDVYTAMGGQGTAARWYEERPRLMGGDLTHPTAQGAQIVGDIIYKALADAFEAHRAK